MVIEANRLLNVREASEILSICERTLHNITSRGQLKSVRIGRAVRYNPSELQRFVEAQQNGDNAE